jgi:hypothetical protein
MENKRYVVRFKPSELKTQTVIATGAETHGEHVILLDSKGKLAALFLAEAVESWSESPLLPSTLANADPQAPTDDHCDRDCSFKHNSPN